MADNKFPKTGGITAMRVANYEAEQARQRAERDQLKTARAKEAPNTLTVTALKLAKLQAQINTVPVKRAQKPEERTEAMSRLTDRDIMEIAEVRRGLILRGPSYSNEIEGLLAIIDRLAINTTKGTGNIKTEEINKVITLVQDMRGKYEEQLTILSHALVVGCKANGVDVLDAINNFAQCFNDTHEVINDGAPAARHRLDS